MRGPGRTAAAGARRAEPPPAFNQRWREPPGGPAQGRSCRFNVEMSNYDRWAGH